MLRNLIAFFLVFGMPLSVIACLWDRDTLATEARGLPELVAILTGRFERNPALYYEMRLTRIQSQIDSESDDLNAYDDAAVACDRLGQHDAAIEWMARKRLRLDRMRAMQLDIADHDYRYHANLGTFIIHQWISNGADRSSMGPVERACLEIEKAIELNPDAHFGREKYQLRAMRWILDPPQMEPYNTLPSFVDWPPGIYDTSFPDPEDVDEAMNGLMGLVVLGNAWESVDVFYALNLVLQVHSKGFAPNRTGGRNSLAYFAWLRCSELIEMGRGSLVPGAPAGRQLKDLLYRPDFVGAEFLLDPEYQRLRAEADLWQRERTEFMIRRLETGLHPDTAPNFWEGYTSRSAPSLSDESVPTVFERRQIFKRNIFLSLLLSIPTVLLGLGTWYGFRRFRS
ncbi:hypothetical protein SH449x_003592 [Pirellulaceae bacterium SH449]